MRRAAILITAALLLTACRTPKVVEFTEVVHDTTYVEHTRVDTLIRTRDSIVIERVRDSVIIERDSAGAERYRRESHYEGNTRVVHDTTFVYKEIHDTAYVSKENTEQSVVEKPKGAPSLLIWLCVIVAAAVGIEFLVLYIRRNT